LSARDSYRAQTKLIVSMSPGVHIRRLQKLLGASFSTTRYHVDKLERAGEIVRSKDGRYDRLYPTGTPENMKAVYAVLQSDNARKVLQALVEDGRRELTNGELSELTRLPRSTVSECVTAISRTSLVRRSLAADGRILFKVQDREEVLAHLAAFRRSLLNIAADNFIDLWDL
jgi:DNA-binding IclR family transcriptional regulator